MNGRNAHGIYKSSNGFTHRLTGYYPAPGATLTESFIKLKDGRTITCEMWSWPNGATQTLTRKSDVFFSFVGKDASGNVCRKTISHNPQHLDEYLEIPTRVDGKFTFIPLKSSANGNNITCYRASDMIRSQVAASDATVEAFTKEARRNATLSFNSIGQKGFHLHD